MIYDMMTENKLLTAKFCISIMHQIRKKQQQSDHCRVMVEEKQQSYQQIELSKTRFNIPPCFEANKGST